MWSNYTTLQKLTRPLGLIYASAVYSLHHQPHHLKLWQIYSRGTEKEKSKPWGTPIGVNKASSWRGKHHKEVNIIRK